MVFTHNMKLIACRVCKLKDLMFKSPLIFVVLFALFRVVLLFSLLFFL